MANQASKALLLSRVFLHFRSPALHWNSYNCHCYNVNIESYSCLEFIFNSIFSLKVPWLVLVFCHFAGQVWVTYATFMLIVVPCLSMYCVRKVISASKFFLSFVWMCFHCRNFCGQLVTPDAIQQVMDFQSWIKALVSIFLHVLKDNLVCDMSGHTLFQVPCLLLSIMCWCLWCCLSICCCCVHMIWV